MSAYIRYIGTETNWEELPYTGRRWGCRRGAWRLTASSTSSPTPVTQVATAAFTAGASDADNKVLVVDVFDPALRYVFASLTRTTANAVVDGIIAIQYTAGLRPTTQDASVLASAIGPGLAS